MDNSLPFSAQCAALVIQTAVIIFAARLAGKLAEKCKIPPVLGELAAGIIIGPYFCGSFAIPFTGFSKGLFPLPSNSIIPVNLPIYFISVIGSIILLFISGLETDIKKFIRYSTVGTMVGFGGAAVSFATGMLFGTWIFKTPVSDPRCLFLGILCTATSVGITARILADRKKIDSPEGTTILAAAVFDDVISIIGLAIVMGIINTEVNGLTDGIDWGHIGKITFKSISIWLGFTAAGLIFAKKIAAFLKSFPPLSSITVLASGMALLLAGIFEKAGLAMIIGAYVMGLSLSGTDIAIPVRRNIQGLYEFFVPVFFTVMGMMTDIRIFFDTQVLIYGLIYTLLAILAKVAGCAVPAYFMDFNMLGSLRIGAGMIPRGEVALIIAGIGSASVITLNDKQTPILSPELFGVAIIMIILTTAAVPFFLSYLLKLPNSGLRVETAEEKPIHTSYDFSSETVRDFVLHLMLDNFHHAGFHHKMPYAHCNMINFNRGEISFTMEIKDNSFIFSTTTNNTDIIRQIMRRTLSGIRHDLDNSGITSS